ncbi:hypothetical protein ACFOW6_00265 [Fodinicurvata halophila]|uniref:Serine/threonine protein phosphatase 1 n=1 Tax=Fodinicurvata halophila TaxID=1419723 RepID=A0ABV8UH52_9PROT
MANNGGEMSSGQIFGELSNTQRVWAVASIHGEAERLVALHEALWPRAEPGDRLVYLGNMIGRGAACGETLDELLGFRTAFLTLEPSIEEQVVFLRGGQEEMWQKLLQLQFATDPRAVLEWMLQQGVGATLETYGFDPEEARRVAGSGTVGLTRWTQSLRSRIQSRPGHYEFMGSIRRAAYTEDHSLLFVHSGFDPSRPLETQRDSFWWSSNGFATLEEPYSSYRRVVRGFEKNHPGLVMEDYTLTLDGGCGFGGPLLAACLLPDGQVVDMLEV